MGTLEWLESGCRDAHAGLGVGLWFAWAGLLEAEELLLRAFHVYVKRY